MCLVQEQISLVLFCKKKRLPGTGAYYRATACLAQEGILLSTPGT